MSDSLEKDLKEREHRAHLDESLREIGRIVYESRYKYNLPLWMILTATRGPDASSRDWTSERFNALTNHEPQRVKERTAMVIRAVLVDLGWGAVSIYGDIALPSQPFILRPYGDYETVGEHYMQHMISAARELGLITDEEANVANHYRKEFRPEIIVGLSANDRRDGVTKDRDSYIKSWERQWGRKYSAAATPIASAEVYESKEVDDGKTD